MEENRIQGVDKPLDINVFQDKLNKFIESVKDLMYIVEVTKSACNYSTFITIYKNQSLNDLYKIICLHFDIKSCIKLYTKNNDESTLIPSSEMIKIRDYFVYTLQLRSIYDNTTPIVYRVYLDDCHKH